MMFLETLGVTTVSEANLRENRHVVAARKKNPRTIACVRVKEKARGFILALPLVVKMTRLSPRELDDDNLCSSLKATRDGIADALAALLTGATPKLKGDRDPRVRWEYAQERSGTKAVRVEVTW